MNELLRAVMTHCAFLYEPHGDEPGRYRFVDSHAVTSFGDAYIVLASRALRIRFVRDRGFIAVDLQPLARTNERDWYDLGLVHRHLTGERLASAELDERLAAFLRDNLNTIEHLFSPERFEATSKTLSELGRERAKEVFG